MKRFFLILTATLMLSLPVFAQTTNVLPEEISTVFDLTTFTGLVAFTSLVFTAGAKLIPAIANAKSFVKVLISAVVGSVAAFVAWKLSLADFLAELPWWKVLLQGLFAGLTASGAFDLFKGLFKTE